MNEFVPTILAVDDEADFRTAIAALLEQEGMKVFPAADGIEAINYLQKQHFDAMILDLHMPRVNGMEVLQFLHDRAITTPTIILTAVQDIHTAVETIKKGAFDFVTKPVQPADLLNLLHRAMERTRLLHENTALRRSLERLESETNIIGASPGILACLDLATRVAASDSSILIQGSTGTGKELFAAHIHRKSRRSGHPFLAINCSAIPETLIESEMFGHEKGAFTDASAVRQGLVEIADGGTLFLDEIGELALAVQPKLLRFLQTGEYRRVGGNQTRTANVRIVSATHKDLITACANGRFREDLFYRLNVVTLTIPPLKDRVEDIPLLADHFLKRKQVPGRPMCTLHPSALRALSLYSWPGNVRELENVLERAAILSTQAEIRSEDLALDIRGGSMNPGTTPRGVSAGQALTLKQMEREHIVGVLESVNRDKKLAAKILGISLKTLYTKLHQHHIEV